MYGPRWAQKPPAGTPLDPSQPLAAGLAAFWPLAEGTGVPADLVSGVAASSNNATWTGSPVGLALSFNGTSQYVRVPITPALAIGGPFTLAVFAAPPATANGFLADFRNIAASYNGYTMLLDGSGHLTFGINNGGTAQNITTTTTTADGNWHVFAGSQYSTATSGSTIYFDGRPAFTGTQTAFPQTTAASGAIGARQDGTQKFLAGPVGWVAVWSRALSAAEHASLAADPWAIFRPRYAAAWSYAAAGGGGGGGLGPRLGPYFIGGGGPGGAGLDAAYIGGPR